ncbi:hypothetical protein ACKI1O_48125, partial [Streptomyces scabiei]
PELVVLNVYSIDELLEKYNEFIMNSIIAITIQKVIFFKAVMLYILRKNPNIKIIKVEINAPRAPVISRIAKFSVKNIMDKRLS